MASPTTGAEAFVTQYQANQQWTSDERDAYATAQQFLNMFGLPGLTDWVFDQMKKGATAAQIYLEIQKTPQFEQRFPAIKQMREAGASHIPTPEEYIQMEDSYTKTAHAAGLVPGLLTREKMASLIAGGVSPAEFDDRVAKGYQRVAQADPTVREAFKKYFGVLGDQALASYFLDPQASLPILERQATAAVLGGQAKQALGEWFGADRMQQLAANGWDEQSARSGFDRLGQMAGMFDETLSERRDLTAEREGISAVFGVDQQPDGLTTLDNAMAPGPLGNDPLNGQDGENRTRGQWMNQAQTGAFAGEVPSAPVDVSGDGSALDAQKEIEARRRNRVGGSSGRSSSYRGRQGETSGLGTADR